MSIHYSTNWEVRPGGSANNGGGFAALTANSVDHSQQDNEQLHITDGVHAAGSATLTSVIGGFTSDLEGNVGKVVSGTGFTTGYYQILTVVDSNTLIMDRSLGAGAGSNGNIYIGGGTNSVSTILSVMVGRNIAWIKSGSYTGITMSITTGNLHFRGYKTTHGDVPTGNDRPSLTFSSTNYLYAQVSLFTISHVIIIGAGSYGIRMDGTGCVVCNCSIRVTRASGNIYGIYINAGSGTSGGGDSIFNCDFTLSTADNTYGVYDLNGNADVIGCVFDGLTRAIYRTYATYNRSSNTIGNIIANCTNGIVFGSAIANYALIKDNVFYNNSNYAVWSASNPPGSLWVLNNIFLSNEVGIRCDYSSPTNVPHQVDYNCFYDNDTDCVNISKDDYNITLDPKFTDPAGGDFSLQSDSPCLKGLRPIGFYTGEFMDVQSQ